ncbi:MAG TPA: hypothetical protein VM571_02875 [Noviherbaspirillum sp.]|nr:hypothetical protein [Noviherbaspirillum sp.]
MKTWIGILVVMLLAGCAGMDTSGGTNGTGSVNQTDINRHDDPSDPYFGG